MSTVYLTVGVSASGKSTWARENAKDLDAAIVCRDDIRIMQGLKHGDDEQKVTDVQRALIEGLILENKNVIVADTNISKKFRNQLVKFCHRLGADVEIVLFEIDLDTAILRDNFRSAKVGPDVIRKQHEGLSGQLPELRKQMVDGLPVQSFGTYSHSPRKRDAIVVDIDGTVAKHWNRNPYEYSKVGDDKPIADVVGVITSLASDYQIIFVSGRDDSCARDTADWIFRELGLDVDEPGESQLLMRKTGDQRPDWVIKNEIYDEKVLPWWNVVMVFDDRDQVVHHLRRRGITVAQVAPGRF